MPDWLKNFFTKPPVEEKFNLGANLDTRTPAEIAAQDIPVAETVAAAAPVDWKEISPESIRTFGVQNQKQKSDCVAETRRKLKRIMLKVNKNLDLDFSSVAFYRKRSNYPKQGMIAADAISLDKNVGMTLDALVPSDAVASEQAANALSPEAFNDDVAKVFRTSSDDVVFVPGDIDTPAGTIQKTRKGVMVWFFATVAEWSKLVPTIDVNLTGPQDPRAIVVHSVTGIEPALYKGQQGIWIDDSAAFGGLSRRFVTRAFYEKRNWWASYPISFKFEAGVGTKPHYVPGDTVSLQDCLKFEGTFPSNVDSTGVYGPLTTQAVKDFQTKYGLDPVGTVGPKTTAKLQTLYP